MNFDKYTDRSRGFVQSAQSLPLREGHQQFAPEHLLKVLLDDPEGLAAGLGENLAGFAASFEREREQKPLDGDKAVAGFLACFLGRVEHTCECGIEIDLPGAAARNLRALGQCRLNRGQGLP